MKSIKVNGETHQFNGNLITYRELVEIAGLKHGVVYSATYHHKDRAGIMNEDSVIPVFNGMRFNIYHTGNA